MITRPNTNKQRMKRHKRVRAKISGTPVCPRLNVFRSEANIYAQIIDDVNGVTLASASSLDKEIEGNGGNKAAARAVGKLVAERCKAKGIDKVLERRERGHQIVIDLDARKAFNGIHGCHGIAVHQRVVDFARLARQNRVARDRHQGELIVRRINAHQCDDVGVLIQLSMVRSLARVQSRALPGVGPDQQNVEGVFVLDHGKLQRV